MILYLPFPPSVNGLYATNWKTKRRFPTKKYTAWKLAAELAKDKQWRTVLLTRFEVPVVATYSFGRPDKRRRDVENYSKAVSDFLVDAKILADDSLIERLLLQWARVDGCVVEIVPFTT